jgi:hypothetical protein
VPPPFFLSLLKLEFSSIASIELAVKLSYHDRDSMLIEQEDTQMGYTTEVSVLFPEDSPPEVCYISTEVHDTHKMQCPSPAVVVLEPSPLPSPTVISPGPYKTSLQVGSTTTNDHYSSAEAYHIGQDAIL